jgi:hypothetical protein
MVDWLYPDSKHDRKSLRQSSILLQVCSHLANGSKHFVALAKHHDSVRATRAEGPAFQRDVFQPDAFQVGRLFVELKCESATVLGNHVEVSELARKVLDDWKKRLG